MTFELKDKVITLCERDGIPKGCKGEIIQAHAYPQESYMVQFNDEYGVLIKIVTYCDHELNKA